MKTALLAAVLLTACANPPDYDVVISPNFTAEQAQGIRSGMDLWETAAPEVHFHEFGSQKMYVFPKETCPHLLEEPHIGYTFPDYVICLDTLRIPSAWMERTMAHELGHALGLGHRPAPSIMATDGATAPAPTQADVEAMRRVHAG